MRLLLLAPEIMPPYTEGRKRFVVDLAEALSKAGHEITLLTSGTAPAATAGKWRALSVTASQRIGFLLAPLTDLPQLIQRASPDAVLIFPYGTFSGLHFVPARTFLFLANRICRNQRVPCFTITYSIDRKTRPDDLQLYVSHLVTGHIEGWTGPKIAIGRESAAWPHRPQPAGIGRRLLFLAGMRKPTRKIFQHILRVRGLVYLLRAGADLSSAGVSLHVSIPALGSPECQTWLLKHPENAWPADLLHISAEANVPAVFFDADMFVFPYAEPITQFTPTSILEAMLAGTPVVMSDLPFLRHLALDGTASVFKSGNGEGLRDAILSLFSDTARLRAQAKLAHEKARQSWSIERTTSDLLAVLARYSHAVD